MHERRMAGRTGRAVARPARVARTHAPRVLLAAVALIVLLLQTGVAYALPWQEKDGYPLGNVLMNENVGTNRGTAVYGAANEFFATLCLIGRKSDYLQLSSEQLSELSGEGTGGAFYELSQRWSNYGSDGAPATWPFGITLAIEGQGLISDPAYIWYADYSYYESDSLYQRALADYLTIYNGGHLGGGGPSDPFVLSCNVKPSVYSANGRDPNTYQCGTFGGVFYRVMNLNVNGVIYPAVMPDITVQFTDPKVSQYLSQGYKLYVTASPYVNDTFQALYVDAVVTNMEPTITDISYTASGGLAVPQVVPRTRYSFTPDRTHLIYKLTGNRVYASSDGTFVVTATGSDVSNGSSTVNLSNPTDTGYTNSWANFGITGGGGGGGGGGTWPEPDPNPEPDPPRVPEPEPGGPDIEPPDPYNPIVEPTPEPDPITDPYVVVVAPDSQDIIPWLRAILQAINNLGDKLNAESTELQNALNKTFFNNLSKLLRNLKGEFIQDYTSWLDHELEWFNSEIHDYFVDLQTYLYHLFDWLSDQMNFEVNLETDPYDDTSLLNWLRRIYNKLGADGGPNTRPVDPSTDPEGFLDWLRRIIAEFILGLGASASDFVSDLGDLLSRLFAKFPFSVPWDLLGILGLLDAAPVAPRANFTIPLTIGNYSFSWTIDINLTGWSTYMESVRTIILVSFISWLAWLTPSVLRDLDPGDFL